jgi:hypothetical protein
MKEEHKEIIEKLSKIIKKSLPKGFKEIVKDNYISYVVPLSLYPSGYHCTPNTPLPFMGIASNKNFIAIHHMGIYTNKKLSAWFKEQWPKHNKLKLDMGASCIRLKKLDQIPYDLIAELATKMTVEEWTSIYEKAFKK